MFLSSNVLGMGLCSAAAHFTIRTSDVIETGFLTNLAKGLGIFSGSTSASLLIFSRSASTSASLVIFSRAPSLSLHYRLPMPLTRKMLLELNLGSTDGFANVALTFSICIDGIEFSR